MNSANLKPFKKGFDSRRQNGRKSGSKNTSTLVKKFLEQDLNCVKNQKIQEVIEKFGCKNAHEAIILALLLKAMDGDYKSAKIILDYANQSFEEELSFFNGPVRIEIIKSRKPMLKD